MTLGSPRKKTIAAGPAAKKPAVPTAEAALSPSARAASDPLAQAGPKSSAEAASSVEAAPRKAARRPKKAKAEPGQVDLLQKLIVTSLEDDKAENVVTLDLTGKAMFCDRMVIASGLADRQITAMAQHLREKLHAAGQRRVQIEGLGGSDWVLIDAGDIVVHLFRPDARALYALEKMWGEELDEPAGR